MPSAPSSVLVTASKALVTSSDALVSTSFLLLLTMIDMGCLTTAT